MGVDHGDGRQETDRMGRRVKRLETAYPNGHAPESLHPGSGDVSTQVGPDVDASGDGSVALGFGSTASNDMAVAMGGGDASGGSSIAIGSAAEASGHQSVAIGGGYAAGERAVALGWFAYAYNDYEFMLGSSGHTVVVPGTFSNPSARRLKRNITPAPPLTSIFSDLVEYEYAEQRDIRDDDGTAIGVEYLPDGDGRRRLGLIADELIGTDAERFVTFNDDGEVAGIAYLDLLVAQVAQLHARVVELESNWLVRLSMKLRRRHG